MSGKPERRPQWRPANLVQLDQLCFTLNLEYDKIRNVMAQCPGLAEIERSMGSGHHRRFNKEQAICLTVVGRLNQSGLPVPLAGRIAQHVFDTLLSGERPKWNRVSASLKDGKECFLEIGDTHLARLAIEAPGGEPKREQWQDLKTLPHRRYTGEDPVAIVRVNLSKVVAQVLPLYPQRPPSIDRKAS